MSFPASSLVAQLQRTHWSVSLSVRTADEDMLKDGNASVKVANDQTGPWNLTGAFQFTGSGHPGAWNSDKGTWSPRIGAAYRLNDKTSVRVGYGRYTTPWSMDENAQDQFGAPTTGYSNYTDAPPTVLGVPQMSLSNPFPASYPIVPSSAKTYGAYTAIGSDLTYFAANRPHSFSNRLNISVQRQLPQGIIADVTYFYNHTSQVNNINYNHCCPRQDRPITRPAENTRLGGTPVGYLVGGLRFEVSQPVQVIPKPG